MNTTTHPAAITHHTGACRPAGGGERGYALLGLLLALSVIAIYLTSAIVPNIKMEVQRSKEAEMIYRGNQIAKAIARYYGGFINPATSSPRMFPDPPPLRPPLRPPYGPLLELKKLRDSVTFGVQEVKFARAIELIDPMTGVEWEPVRARDPRINPFLQAYTAETGVNIQPYLIFAGPPVKVHKIKPDDSQSSSTSQSETQQGQPGGEAPVQPQPNRPPKPDDDDDDDDDDLDDPLGHFFESKSDSSSSFGSSTVPIIGVAPKLKGKASRSLYGLDRYEDWIFIYIPSSQQGFVPGQSNQPNQPGGGLKISP